MATTLIRCGVGVQILGVGDQILEGGIVGGSRF